MKNKWQLMGDSSFENGTWLIKDASINEDGFRASVMSVVPEKWMEGPDQVLHLAIGKLALSRSLWDKALADLDEQMVSDTPSIDDLAHATLSYVGPPTKVVMTLAHETAAVKKIDCEDLLVYSSEEEFWSLLQLSSERGKAFHDSLSDAVSLARARAGGRIAKGEIEDTSHVMAQKREDWDGSPLWAVAFSDRFDEPFMVHLSDQHLSDNDAVMIEEAWNDDWTEVQKDDLVLDMSLGSPDFCRRSSLNSFDMG